MSALVLALVLVHVTNLHGLDHHICRQLASGKTNLGIISITFDSDGHIQLFTSFNSTFYNVAKSKLTGDSLDLTDAQVSNFTEKLFGKSQGSIIGARKESVKAYYHFDLGWHKNGGLVIADKMEYMINMDRLK